MASGKPLLAAALVLLLLLGGVEPARAAALGLYQAQTIVTGQGEATRTAGVAKCLEDVLVKVSGDPRLIGHPGALALTNELGPLVRDFSYLDRMAGIPVHDEQGTRDRPFDLTVSFHPQRIDAALASLGRRPWTDRPRLAVLVGTRIGSLEYILTREAPQGRDMREALAAVAQRLGMSTALPEDEAVAGLDAGRLLRTDASDLAEAGRMAGGDVVLVGTLLWSDADLGWIADWRLASNGTADAWGVRGVSFDRAFAAGVSGATQILSGNGRPD